MKVNELFPSKYLKAPDLGGRETTVTIARVEARPVGRTKDICPVVFFTGKQKGLILNRTNARTIAEITGSQDTETWPGRRICLFVTKVEYAGRQVDTIRIKAAAELRAVQ